jgi:hypothetical protein
MTDKISFKNDVLKDYLELGAPEGELFYDERSSIAIKIANPTSLTIFTKLELSSDEIRDNKAFQINKVNLAIPKNSPVLYGEHYLIEFIGTLNLTNEDVADFYAAIIDVILRSLYRGPEAAKKTLTNMSVLFEKGIAKKEMTLSSLLGLIGELAFILESEDKNKAVAAWHNDIYDTYDFDFGSSQFEIKTTLKQKREHSFSNSQIHEEVSDSVNIASVKVSKAEKIVDSTNIFEMYEAIWNELEEPELFDKLDSLIEETVGVPIGHLPRDRFTIDTIRVYPACSIPRPEYDSSIISNIRWTVELNESKGYLLTEGILESGIPVERIERYKNKTIKIGEKDKLEKSPPNSTSVSEVESVTNIPVVVKLDKKGRIPKSENKKLAAQLKAAGFDIEKDWELAKKCKLPGFTYKP